MVLDKPLEWKFDIFYPAGRSATRAVRRCNCKVALASPRASTQRPQTPTVLLSSHHVLRLSDMQLLYIIMNDKYNRLRTTLV